MKAQTLWPKHDYAYIPDRGRNQHYHHNAKRIQIKRVYQVTHSSNKNATTYVDAFLLKVDGSFAGTELTRVRAYDIVDFWGDWWVEYGEKYQQHLDYVHQLELDRQKRIKERQDLESALKSAHPLFAQARIHVGSSSTDIYVSNKLIKEILNLEHISSA